MISQKDFLQAMNGCLMLFSGRAEGLSLFDISFAGFWRSFQAMILVALPFMLLLILQPEPSSLQGSALLASGMLSFLIGWISFPLLALLLCSLFPFSDRYVGLIVVVNWMAVPQIAIFLGAAIVALVLSPGLAGLWMLIVSMAVIYVHWFAVKTALASHGLIAAAFVFLDLVINQTIRDVVDNLFTV